MAAPLKLHTVLRLFNVIPAKGNIHRAYPAFFNRHFNTSSSENTLAQQFIQATEAKNPKRSICRTPESNVAAHTIAHEGMFYTIPQEDVKQWLDKAFHTQFHRLTKAFQETCVMVRTPAIEILECMRAANYNLPVVRYVMYGYHGCGKTTSLGHIMHYCGQQGWLLLHVPWAAHWNRYYREGQVSSYNPTRFDQPLDGMEWLAQFRKMNEVKLKQLDMKMTNHYVWNKREAAEVGSPLMETIEFGLSRSKYACDVVGAVLKEIRLQAASRGFKVLVAVDGVNAFWEMSTLRRTDDKSYVASEYLSLTHNFKKMLRNDWAGGAVVCTADGHASPDYLDKSAFLPNMLLKKEGFEWMDPYIPIHVPNYSDKEIRSCLEYFTERKWIQNPHALTEEGKKEIIFLSCNNPLELVNVTKSW